MWMRAVPISVKWIELKNERVDEEGEEAEDDGTVPRKNTQ